MTQYDVDNSGYLDRAEVVNFIRDTMRELTGDPEYDFSDREELLETIAQIDTNDDGKVAQKEVVAFIRTMM